MQYPKKYQTIQIVLSTVVLVLLFSCAQVVAPGGGPKDSKAPQALKYTPDSAALNFNTKSIIINFNEFIQLNDVANQLIVSPPLEFTPDIQAKGKDLIIELNKKEVLKPNTTYCFSFGNALRDVNEGNIKDNFSYIFSTGSYLDSLTLKGKVKFAFNQKTEKGILVMLYSDMTDSVVYKKLPDYFAKTKEDGSYQINNIRLGKYKVFALKDDNANYKYDSETEFIGFSDSLADVSLTNKMDIVLFQEPAKKLFLKKYFYGGYGKLVFVFSTPSDSIVVKPVNYEFKETDVLLNFSAKKDSLTYWFRNIEKDSLYLQISNGSKVLDTIEVKLTKMEEALKNSRNPLKFNLINSPNGNKNFDLNSIIHLNFSHPISEIKKDIITLKEDSLSVNYSEKLSYVKQSNSMIVDLLMDNKNIPLKENKNYRFIIPTATFIDFFGLKNDSINIDFNTREEKYYGSLKLKLNAAVKASGNYIVQLLDEKENIIKENFVRGDETIQYQYLHPKNYILKVIYDNNSNQKWDAGNLFQKIQPERVTYYTSPITIRSNWDMDLEWKLD